MEQASQVTRKSSHDASSQLSKWTFCWIIPLFRLGYRKELELSDLDECCRFDEPTYVTSLLEREWMKELSKRKSGKKASLVRALFRAFGLRYFVANTVTFIGELGLRLAQPFLVGKVIHYLMQQPNDQFNMNKDQAIGYAAGIVITCFLYCTSKHRTCILLTRVGNNVRSSLSALLFKKLMKLSSTSMSQTDVGQVINIMANDLTRVEDLSWFAAFAVVGPLMCIIVVYFTCIYLNWAACIAGFAMLMLFMAFQAGMGWLFSKYRRLTTEITDERVNKMSELISAMKIIKLYCWEDPFADVVDKVRRREIEALRGTYYLKGINLSFYFIATRFMVFAAFITYVLKGNSLQAEQVFVIMTLYDAIRLPVTGFFPSAISLGAETLVTCKRIEKILLLDERNVVPKGGSNEHEKGSISFRSYEAKWTKDSLINNLSGITLDISPGELVVVIGSVGSGKTCFLHALLDEIEKTGGHCNVSGNISYAPQESWCFGGSVKQNILLSNGEDMNRLKKVIKVCGLERDLELFPEAEKTFVGEKGYSLSGGQKARISLARSVYHEADVYLLDDPLSAVDPKVANHIFNRCIKGYLQYQRKTVVLVTHQLQFLREADKVLVLDKGTMIAYGSYAQLLSANFDFLSHLDSDASKKPIKKESANAGVRTASVKANSFSEMEDSLADIPDEEPAPRSSTDREEQRSTGQFDSRIYWRYLKASGRPVFIFLSALLSLLAQGLYQFNDFWLSAWTQKSTPNVTAKALGADAVVDDDTYNVIIYAVLIIILFVLAFLRSYVTFLICLSSSINIHDSVFKSLLRAPIAFYESNPLGRILNRCTRDVGVIDQVIPSTLADVISYFLNIMSVVTLSVIVNQWLLIPCAILGIGVVIIRNFYIRTGRDLQRLDAIARSPVYDHVGTTLNGLMTVRAFRVEDKFEHQFYRFMRDSVACRFLVMSSQRAIGFFLDVLSNVYILCITIAIMAVSREEISGADAGLMLSSSLMIMNCFQYCIRLSCDFETQMISCERVMEYENIEPEKQQAVDGMKPGPEWPALGTIQFENVSLWYSKSLPPVLHDLSLDIESGEKIGIVGRTGAGKSSLISCLFRLAEPEGRIVIDGLDILTLSLRDVRNRISIIPQDPVLFSGTVRQNLDPFVKYSDERIWEALQESNLQMTVKEMDGMLYAHVSEGGSNLSVGQRQLLCLARALLRKNKILVCDEATANVDHETDELIRKTIKDKFHHCTILTVAHRLNTIIDMDRVMVMEAGQVVEFDEPYNLLRNTNGLFLSMVRETGTMFENMLMKAAEAAFLQKHGVIDGRL